MRDSGGISCDNPGRRAESCSPLPESAVVFPLSDEPGTVVLPTKNLKVYSESRMVDERVLGL